MRVLQRVVWNSKGWRCPTAASNEAGYPADHGFGHEEWNFQTDDAVDGDVVGYIYWRPGARALVDSGGTFDIGFWAIHPHSRRRLLVGRYTKARLADDAFLDRVTEQFDERGIFERRAQELRMAVPDYTAGQALNAVREGFEQRWMRFRCAVRSVVALEPGAYVDVPERIQNAGLSLRFASPTFVDAFPETLRTPGGEYTTSPTVEDAYVREVGAQLQTIVPLHNALANSFATWLQQRRFENVRHEAFRVDIEFGSSPDLHRAELKTCHGVGTTKAIREALGQLLEYNHYGLRVPAKAWWVVLDREPSAADLAFIATLRRDRQLPLVLAWREGSGFKTDVAVRGKS